MMWGILAAAAVIVIWAMGVYNGLVKLRNLVKEAWSGIDVQLKRRFDLIPNLVETVKGYASHERETFENVTAARAAITKAGSDPAARLQAENALTGTLRSLFAVAENYPELKANANFMNLQGELSAIENEIQMARRYYNGTARNMNTKIEQFPAVIIARQMGFKEAPYFEAEESERKNVTVSFGQREANAESAPARGALADIPSSHDSAGENKGPAV